MKTKFSITDWIGNQSIYPLAWGDSKNEIIKFFSGSKKEVVQSRETKTPFICLDFVEFYFDDDINYKGLNTIIIKCVGIYKGMKTKYFEKDWLRIDLSFEDTCRYLSNLKVDYITEYEKHDKNTPVLKTQSGQTFVFYDYSIDQKYPLHKIYIQV